MIESEVFFQDILRKAGELGYEEAEVFYEAGISTEVQVLKGEISMYESSSTRGVSFRGRKHGQMGYAYSEELTEESMAFLLEQAEQNCIVLESEDHETVYAGDDKYETVNNYSEELSKMDFQALSENALSLEKGILSYDKRIIAVDHCAATYGESELRIVNSLGLDLSYKSNMMFIYASARCEEDDSIKTGADYWCGRDFSRLDIAVLAEKIAVNALEKLAASSIPSEKYPVVLEAEAASDLLSTFSGIFSADMVQKGFSLLGDRIGQNIASSCVTLRDDALTPLSITRIPFDSEGVSTKNKVLIENGVLKSFLHNRKTAEKDNTISTGNGFRSGFKGSVSVGTTNFFIVPGEKSRYELIASVENGVYIKELSGLHAGANIISGDFSLSCEGFLIQNGKIDRPIDQITVAENFFSLLMKIEAVGSDLYFNPPSDAGATGCPTLLIRDIAISGE
jgi:PmbA protein